MSEQVRKLYAVEQVRELDRRAIAAGTPGYILMQRAAAAAWSEIARRWPERRRIDVLCGAGNNGGDGYELARLALRAQYPVHVWQLQGAPQRGDAQKAYQAWMAEGGTVGNISDFDDATATLVIDALYGTGLSRDLEAEAVAVVHRIGQARQSGAAILSLDVPSGLDADTGAVRGAAVAADVTVTFVGDKPGLHTGAGREHAGEVVFADLDLPPQADAGLTPVATLMDAASLSACLPRRRPDAHKGHHGHVLLIGGNHGMPGAIVLAARAALRSGAGLVSVATRASHAVALSMAQPEIMSHAVEQPSQLSPLLDRASVIGIGPGLGQDAWAQAMLAAVLQSSVPKVLDADALNLLAEEPARDDRWILTPHPGEAARLLNQSTAAVQRDRGHAARELRARYGGVIVLKGAGTWVQGRSASLCPYGNPGMAVGGMGDVLTGVIAALVAQGLAPERAAATGVLVHARAGDQASSKGERGLLPSDVIERLRGVVNP